MSAMEKGKWARPKACGSNGSCVEVFMPGNGWDFVRIRCTEDPEQYVVATEDEWRAFIDAVKAGEFDLEDE